MPKQDFTINTLPAAAGDVYGLAFTNSTRLTFSTEAAQSAYGLAVQQGAKSNTIKVGHVSGEVLGITMRQNVLESKTRPGDGTINIPVGQPLAVMMEGSINIVLKTAITSAEIGVSATGEFGGVDATYTKAVNIKALSYPAAAGDVIPVHIVVALPKP
ncbi:structural protein [Erwinia phage Aioli]|nr:structural protein [Erwinia phage Aioli]